MTGRERLVTAARGGETDQRPVLARDAVVVPDSDSVSRDAGRAVLVEVANPFGQALDRGDDPRTAVVAEMVEETRGALRDALDAGADGVFYRLHGARADVYGPYREHDLALLNEIADARLNVVFAVGRFDPSLLAGLPAPLFAWDVQASGLDSAAVRAVRPGAQASADPASEVGLT